MSAFGVIVIILSAFNLSLSAHSKSPDLDLQQAAYGFALFAMILCAALIGLFIVLPLISSLATIYGSIATRKRLAKIREDEECKLDTIAHPEQRALGRDDAQIGEGVSLAGTRGNRGGPSAEERVPETADTVARENKGPRR